MLEGVSLMHAHLDVVCSGDEAEKIVKKVISKGILRRGKGKGRRKERSTNSS